jgi:hypothetical protein
MPRKIAPHDKLRARLEKMPVIDCHEHAAGPAGYPKCTEPIARLIQGYVASDLTSAGGEPDMALLQDEQVSTEKKWPVFQRWWSRMEHTGYARVTKLVLQNEYGVKTMSLAAITSIRLNDFTQPEAYQSYLKKHGIQRRLVNMWIDWKKFLAGEHTLPPTDRVLIGLPDYHCHVRSYAAIEAIAQRMEATAVPVTSLDGYLDVCRKQFARFRELGAIGFKDQSAYNRTLDYANPTRAAAEGLFNEIIADPRRSLGWPAAKDLSDFLFHEFMRMAADMDLPVQIHTGHMAGIRNDIAKTNAALLTGVLELHRRVRFDLFHGNWPYAGEWLFLGKNYPNVHLNCCWLHIIDPRYARRVLADSVGVVPHSKVFGFGGDYRDSIEYAAAHLAIAKDNIAAALALLVDEGWLNFDQAVQVAADWLFNNPNDFYRLGLETVRP